MATKPHTHPDVVRLIRRYHANGYGISVLAAHFDLHRVTVSRMVSDTNPTHAKVTRRGSRKLPPLEDVQPLRRTIKPKPKLNPLSERYARLAAATSPEPPRSPQDPETVAEDIHVQPETVAEDVQPEPETVAEDVQPEPEPVAEDVQPDAPPDPEPYGASWGAAPFVPKKKRR